MRRSATMDSLASPRVFLHPGARAVMVGAFAVSLWVLIVELGNASPAPAVWLVLAPVTVLLGLLVFAYQRIEIAGSGVVFTWFPLYRRRLALASIADARVVDVDPWSFGGWGLRLHARGVALTNRGRQGVSVTSTSGRTTIISVENPDRYIHALARHGVPTI